MDLIGQKWEQLSGKLKWLSPGQCGVWGVNNADSIYFRENTHGNPLIAGTKWNKLDGKAKQISCGKMVWCVDREGDIFYRTNISPSNPQGSAWKKVDGKAKQITVSSTSNSVWIVNDDDMIFRRLDVAKSPNQGGSSWENIEGSLSQISSGRSGVWGINSAGLIFYRRGTSIYDGSDEKGDEWVKINGGLTCITSGSGVVMGVNHHHDVFIRENIGPGNPTGTKWQKLQGSSLKHISVDDITNSVWGIGPAGDVFKRVM